MQKWEYTTLTVYEGKIMMVNDQKVGKAPFLGGVQGQSLYSYLSQMGQEGWEVVGLSPTTARGAGQAGHAGELSLSVSVSVVLKRPLS